MVALKSIHVKKSLLTVALGNNWKKSKPETTDVAHTKTVSPC